MMTKKELLRKYNIKQMAAYMVSGGAWFWSGYIVIILLDDVAPLFVANLAGNAVGITINYVLNRYWVFAKKDKKQNQHTARRYVVYTILNAFILNYLILAGLRKVGIEPEIGQFAAAAFFTIWNYLWYKHYVFPEESKQKMEGK